MILVDSSVMIDALRKPDPKLKNLFNTLKPAICGIVKAEILHGARDPSDYAKLVKALADAMGGNARVNVGDGRW